MSVYNTTEYQYTYITTATTTQVFTGRGKLQAITINTPAAGTIGIIDGTTGTTVNVGLIAASSTGTFAYNNVISQGLRIVTGAATDITVTWAKG